MFKTNRSITNLNVTMPGKHDKDHQEPPFLSMLNSNANKRLSFIDKGKSWARQLLKNSNKGLNASQNSFESCDSGIEANFFTRGSFNSKTKFKVPQSSSCSFITSPYISSSSSSNSSTYNSPTAESTLTTSKSTSFSSESSNSSTYDQVYSSPSNSFSSSSGYLVSPVDESGYLVPIITLTNRQSSFSEKRKPALGNNQKIRKNRLSNLIPSCSPLTRSFSTRSAYNQSKPYSHYNPANRATICEQINVADTSQCVRCNCQLNLKQASSECKISTERANAEAKENGQELNKYNQEYNLFESYTCASCIASDSNSASNVCKPPATPAPLPPVDSQRPPQLPQSHPPRCTATIHKASAPTNPPPPLPLLPPPTLQHQPQASVDSLDTNLQNSILLLTNSTEPKKSSENLTNLIQTFKHTSISGEKNNSKETNNTIKITPLLLCSNKTSEQQLDLEETSINRCALLTKKCHLENRLVDLSNRSTNSINSAETLTKSSETLENLINLFETTNLQTTKTNLIEVESPPRKLQQKRKTFNNESIVYIDSTDLENSFAASSSSASLSSSATSSNRSSLSNPNLDLNMNHLIAKLKHTQPTQYSNRKTVNSDYNKLSHLQGNQQHDYHVIDEIINDTHGQFKRPTNTGIKKRLTPTNSLASFDFIDPSYTRLIKLDTSKSSYEKSWENATVILLDKLNEKLASSLIAIANEQKKQLEDDGRGKHVKKCTLREKKLDHQHTQDTCNKRISFPFQRTTILKSASQTLNSSPSSSGHHSFSPEHSPASRPSNSISSTTSSTGSSTSSIQSQKQQYNESNLNGEDVEHLLSMSTQNNEEESENMIKSYTNSSNSTSYQYCYTSESDRISEAWYQPNLPRENVQECLADQEIGSFIIRLSNTCKNCYALSIRVPYFANQNGIAHYLITKNNRGYKLKGVEKEFKSLKSLVTHYSVMQEILPVTLNSLGLSLSNETSKKSNLHEFNDQNNNMACIY